MLVGDKAKFLAMLLTLKVGLIVPAEWKMGWAERTQIIVIQRGELFNVLQLLEPRGDAVHGL